MSLPQRNPWNKGRLISQEPPLKLKKIWANLLRQVTDMPALNAGRSNQVAIRGLFA